MDYSKTCIVCGLDITPMKQISQEEIDKVSASVDIIDVTQSCESCIISVLGELEFPNDGM